MKIVFSFGWIDEPARDWLILDPVEYGDCAWCSFWRANLEYCSGGRGWHFDRDTNDWSNVISFCNRKWSRPNTPDKKHNNCSILLFYRFHSINRTQTYITTPYTHTRSIIYITLPFYGWLFNNFESLQCFQINPIFKDFLKMSKLQALVFFMLKIDKSTSFSIVLFSLSLYMLSTRVGLLLARSFSLFQV